MNRDLFYLEIFFKDLIKSDDRIDIATDFNSNVEQKNKKIKNKKNGGWNSL